MLLFDSGSVSSLDSFASLRLMTRASGEVTKQLSSMRKNALSCLSRAKSSAAVIDLPHFR